ncbi:hypothetical protein FQA39_LY02537 [Lamprigera yunnana]|nr:hypothetical protein FQA39_LY02537 [Lamprigera yunnana]
MKLRSIKEVETDDGRMWIRHVNQMLALNSPNSIKSKVKLDYHLPADLSVQAPNPDELQVERQNEVEPQIRDNPVQNADRPRRAKRLPAHLRDFDLSN